ncbi:MAG: HD domain-containing protein [Gammaproteobacteria bacterium]|nr:HD domain-containing protein [Gammaproteobacteria bacterium]
MERQVSFEHHDILRGLNSKAPVSKKLEYLYALLRNRYDFIDRISVILYEPSTEMLTTFASSSDSGLGHYHAKLNESPALLEIIRKGRPRVVNDLSVLAESHSPQNKKLIRAGFASSYTMPMYRDDEFSGFIFFNSYQADVLEDSVLNDLDMVGHMISLIVANERTVLETLRATVQTAMSFTHQRDPETSGHIDRMSRFAQLIARELAQDYGFDDQFIEHILLFSPLHDLGKIGIPDNILLKPGALTLEEYEVMKSHSARGREMIDVLLRNHGLDGVGYIDMLRNIALYHHEAYDGSGYPKGLKADDIPIEARIVAVADVFDALTSCRPYKQAWSNDDAFDALRELANQKLDSGCVEVLIRCREEVEQIQQRFSENPYG